MIIQRQLLTTNIKQYLKIYIYIYIYIYISKKRQETIDDLRLKEYIIMEYQKMVKVQEIHNKAIYKQLQMRMVKKYLKKDIYLQKKDKNYW